MKTLTQKGDKAWVLADQIVVSGGAFATNLILAKGLGMRGFGLFAVMGLVQLFLLSASTAFGAQVYQVVYAGRSAAEKPRLSNGFVWQQLFGCVLIVALGAAVFALVPFAAIDARTGTIAMAAIALYILQDFLRKMLLTHARARQALQVDLATNGPQLALLLAGWHWSRLNQQTAWAIIAVTSLPSVALALAFIRPGFVSRSNLAFAWQLQRPKTGWLLGSSMLQWGAGYFFVVAGGWWLGPAALGVLRLAQYIYGTLNVLLQALENYVLPRAAAGFDAAFLSKLTRKMAAVMLPLIAVLMISGSTVLGLLGGPGYGSYAYVMWGLGLIYILITFGYPVRIAIRAAHLDNAYFTAYCLSAAMSGCTAPFLIRNYGLAGVLAGMFASQVLSLGYCVFVLQRKNICTWRSFISF